MPTLYKRTDGSLVYATSAPVGGTVVTFNPADPLSTNGPLYRILDSSASTQFHPANYRSASLTPEFGQVYNNVIGSPTDNVSFDGANQQITVTQNSTNRLQLGKLGTSYGISGKRADGSEVFRLDEFGLSATLQAKSMYAAGISPNVSILAAGTVIFSGEPTTTFTATSCTISGTALTIGGTVTGTVAFGQIVYFMDTNGKPCCKRIIAGSGTSWTVETVRGITLPIGGSGNLTSGFLHSVAAPVYPAQWLRGIIQGTTLTLEASTSGLYPGQLILGNGVADNTFVISGSGTSYQVSEAQTTLPLTDFYFPIRGTGTPTANIKLKNFTSDYNSAGKVISLRAEVTVVGLCYRLDLVNTDINGRYCSMLAYNNYSGSAWVARPINSLDSDTSDATSFATTKITPQYLTTGTPTDIVGRDILNMFSLNLDARATTGTTTANTYFTKYAYVAKALTNYISR